MKRSRFTEEQIIATLREQEAGSKTANVCRKHGVSSATFYKWKATYGGMDVSQARKLKVLEDENARLNGQHPPTACPFRQCGQGCEVLPRLDPWIAETA